MTSVPPIEFQWYERSAVASAMEAESKNIQRKIHVREAGPSKLFQLMETMMQKTQGSPRKPLRKRNAKLSVALAEIAEFRQRQEDAADVLSGKKIAVTQEEWDRANDQY